MQIPHKSDASTISNSNKVILKIVNFRIVDLENLINKTVEFAKNDTQNYFVNEHVCSKIVVTWHSRFLPMSFVTDPRTDAAS